MVALNAYADGGTEDATVAAGESGSGDPWDAVVGTPTITYDSEHVRGLRSYKVVGGASAQQLVWTSTSVGTVSELYGRMYLWSGFAPSTANGIVRFVVGGAQAARIRINTDNTLTLADAGNAAEVTTVAGIPNGQWVRVEWRIQFVAAGAAVELRTYNDADSWTATETLTATAAGMGTNCDRVEWGAFNAVTWTAWLDGLNVNTTGFPGPVASPPPPLLRPRINPLLVR